MGGRTLHHRPSRGGRDESRKFEDDYVATLRSYASSFGSAPPTDIWPPVEERFGSRQRWVRINAAEHWILAKPRLAPFAWLLGLSATGCASLGLPSPLELSGKAFLGLYCLLSLAGLLLAWLAARTAVVDEAASEPELSACEVAFLTGGAGLCLETALASLVAQELLHFDAGSFVSGDLGRARNRIRLPIVLVTKQNDESRQEIRGRLATASRGAATRGRTGRIGGVRSSAAGGRAVRRGPARGRSVRRGVAALHAGQARARFLGSIARWGRLRRWRWSLRRWRLRRRVRRLRRVWRG